ncbi:MAG: hypothetical protein A2820_01290 [Candidatus Buchananbacteria bacterium RIFCSPHIGHO2_01_FULL_40_35]|nr:MAG: hypothetical protein A2820_01290 [Candidatus Buchananbacteria bacterium RIFCSPHIGHO2_01_FULL_40_35]
MLFLILEDILLKIRESSWASFHNSLKSFMVPGFILANNSIQYFDSWASFLQINILLIKSLLELALLASQ